MQTGKASGVGSPVLIVGATTGRDGIGEPALPLRSLEKTLKRSSLRFKWRSFHGEIAH